MVKQVFNPEQYQTQEAIDAITMKDIEQMYITSIQKNGSYHAIMIAPFCVCLALHGMVDLLIELLVRFPMIYVDGWTTSLREYNQFQPTFLSVHMVSKGKHYYFKWANVSTTIALLFSDFNLMRLEKDVSLAMKLKILPPLNSRTMWIQMRDFEEFMFYRYCYFKQFLEKT